MADPVPLLPQRLEGLLHHVLGCLLVAHQDPHVPDQAGTLPAKEGIERPLLARFHHHYSNGRPQV